MSDKEQGLSVRGRYILTPKGKIEQTDPEIKGYQPTATNQPEGQNPPTGGSSVKPPKTPGKKDD